MEFGNHDHQLSVPIILYQLSFWNNTAAYIYQNTQTLKKQLAPQVRSGEREGGREAMNIILVGVYMYFPPHALVASWCKYIHV